MDRVRSYLHGDWSGAIAGEAVLETGTRNSSVRSGGRLFHGGKTQSLLVDFGVKDPTFVFVCFSLFSCWQGFVLKARFSPRVRLLVEAK